MKTTAIEKVIAQKEANKTARDIALAREASAELEALKAQLVAKDEIVERIRSVAEFDETTGECLANCGGDAAEGHLSGCQWLVVDEILKGTQE